MFQLEHDPCLYHIIRYYNTAPLVLCYWYSCEAPFLCLSFCIHERFLVYFYGPRSRDETIFASRAYLYPSWSRPCQPPQRARGHWRPVGPSSLGSRFKGSKSAFNILDENLIKIWRREISGKEGIFRRKVRRANVTFHSVSVLLGF